METEEILSLLYIASCDVDPIVDQNNSCTNNIDVANALDVEVLLRKVLAAAESFAICFIR